VVVKKTQTEILEILLIQMIKNQVVFKTPIITSLKESQSCPGKKILDPSACDQTQ
jgi:hypothetical protein